MAARISAGKPMSAGSTSDGAAFPAASLVAAGVSVAGGVTTVVAKGVFVALLPGVCVATLPVEKPSFVLSLSVTASVTVSVAVAEAGLVSLNSLLLLTS